jgi:hypothetical protein
MERAQSEDYAQHDSEDKGKVVDILYIEGRIIHYSEPWEAHR